MYSGVGTTSGVGDRSGEATELYVVAEAEGPKPEGPRAGVGFLWRGS